MLSSWTARRGRNSSVASHVPSDWLAMQSIPRHYRGITFSRTYVDGHLAENLAEKDGRRVPNRAGDCRQLKREEP